MASDLDLFTIDRKRALLSANDAMARVFGKLDDAMGGITWRVCSVLA